MANEDLATKTEIPKGWSDKMTTTVKDEKSSEPTVVTVEMLRVLEAEVAYLKEADSWDYPVGFDGLSEIRFKDKDSKEAMEKPILEELIGRRDWIIQLLEPDCPEIVEGLQSARSEIAAIDALLTPAVKSSPVKPGFLQAPYECAGQLWLFLRSGEFRGNLRNLANAAAGLPERGWKRSQDLCGSNSPDERVPMHPRAYRNFLERNSPQRLVQLESAESAAEVKKILAKSRSTHPVF
jgi:hypothetical protein